MSISLAVLAAAAVTAAAAPPPQPPAGLCSDSGIVTAIQVSGADPRSRGLQVTLNGRANYVASMETRPAVFAGYASILMGSFVTRRPIRITFEPGTKVIHLIEVSAAIGSSKRPRCSGPVQAPQPRSPPPKKDGDRGTGA
jgi:hypothetical protein